MIWAFSLTPSSDLPDNSRRVPSLTGFTYEKAQESLLDQDLAAIRAEEASATIPKDRVIRTDPPSGTIAQPTDLIEVYVSTGAQPVDVPDVTNQPLADAQTAVADLGLIPGSVTRENSPSIAAGLVLRTDPAAATTEKTGVTVNFIVSSGLVALPDLEGQLLSAAIDMLAASEVQLIPIPTPDDTCPLQPGSPVTQQSLAPGDVPQRSEVTLVYCTG